MKNYLINMSQLEDDLKKYTDDALSKKDALAAIALLSEICGAAAIMWAAAAIISALFGPGGPVAVGAGGGGLLSVKNVRGCLCEFTFRSKTSH